MELPRRADGDILLAPGEMTDIRSRLRALSAQHDSGNRYSVCIRSPHAGPSVYLSPT